MIGQDTDPVFWEQLSANADKAFSMVRKPSIRSRIEESFLRAMS